MQCVGVLRALLIAVIEGAPRGRTDGTGRRKEIHNVISRQVPKKYLHRAFLVSIN